MLKNTLLIVLMSLPIYTMAQFKLGVQFSPTLSANRVSSGSDTVAISSDATGLRLSVGPIVDFQLTENYFFSSGILFVSKRGGIEAINNSNSRSVNEEYNLQYVQVPLTLKLFTNEIALDKKIFFQFGGTLEFNVKDDPADKDNYLISDFNLFDTSLLMGVGLEYKVGVNTILYSGLSYHRGLLNSINKHISLDDKIIMKNDYIGLDVGIKL